MRARVVHDLVGSDPLAANAARILAVRVAELRSFVPAAFDPAFRPESLSSTSLPPRSSGGR